MPLVGKRESEIIFDVERNAAYALQVLDAYLNEPAAFESSHGMIPGFFLVKPAVLDALRYSPTEAQSLRECITDSLARNGYVGVTKYYDEKLARHLLEFLPYPYKLGDDAHDSQAEFYGLLSRFILYSREHESIYGDLTAPAEADGDIGPLLRVIGDRAARLNQKLTHYGEAMLLSYDASWPRTEVGRLLLTYANVDEAGHRLFVEYLRHAMRKKAGVGRTWRGQMVLEDTQPNIKHDEADTAATHAQKIDTSLLAERFEMARMRSLHLAKLGEEARFAALQAEEEKVRLEALSVVAARKQIADAQAGVAAAQERLDQVRLARVAEERRIIALEQEQLDKERLARAALASRLEQVQHASHRLQERHEAQIADTDTADATGADGESKQADAPAALITLDFKSVHPPKVAPGQQFAGEDPAYADRLSGRKVEDAATDTGADGQDAKPDKTVAMAKRTSRKKRQLRVQAVVALLFLALGLIGGRFLFHQTQPPVAATKAQPISHPVAVALGRPSASSVPALEAQADVAEHHGKSGDMTLKMSDHLSM